jgi:hypothetical protein
MPVCSTPQPVLVNFRVNPAALTPFDHSCVLAGKSRTQVITELMTEYAAKTASEIPKRILEGQRISKVLKTAAEKVDQRNREDVPSKPITPVRSRSLRKFSSFLELGSQPGGLV